MLVKQFRIYFGDYRKITLFKNLLILVVKQSAHVTACQDSSWAKFFLLKSDKELKVFKNSPFYKPIHGPDTLLKNTNPILLFYSVIPHYTRHWTNH